MLSFSPPLRRLLIAQLPADFADWLDFVAIGAMLAYVWNAPPMAFALMAVAMGAPTLLLGPLLAGRVDRADLRDVMIWANLGRAAATICMAFAPNWPILVALLALRFSVDSAYTPAKQAALQASATEDELTRANQISQAINQLSKLLAPAVGGALIAILTPTDIFLINAVFSLLAALWLIDFPRRLRAPADETSVFQGLKDSVVIIRGNPTLVFCISAMALMIGANFLFDSLIAPHLKALGFPPSALGFVIAASGTGTVIGALLPMRSAPGHMRWELSLGALLATALLLFLGLAEITARSVSLTALVTVFLLFGFLGGRIFVPLRVIMQRETPPEHMARVASVSEAANSTALLIPPFIGAAIAQASSTGWSFIAGAAAFALLAPVLWRQTGR